MKTLQKRLGIYIHWPYCLSKCPYCDFASAACGRADERELLRGYLRDMRAIRTNRVVSSVFFGGGTPSLMSLSCFEKIMRELTERFVLAPAAEITLEANPDAISADKMKAFRDGGVNRLSLGVQALSAEGLRVLGRRHSLETALARVGEAQSIFERVNIDLIYARPGQTPAAWRKELAEALALGAGHYALYQLTIGAGTPFARRGVREAPAGRARRLYELTDALTEAAGCPAYEVSNYARRGQECAHNLLYWTGGDYIGIGPAAHGRLGLLATENSPDVNEWLRGPSTRTRLTAEERSLEKLLTGLRLRQGGYPIRGLAADKIARALQAGWIERRGERIIPTRAGILMLNQLILMLA